MKKFHIVLMLLFSMVLFTTAVFADSADKVIDRYRKAAGGNAVKSIKSTIFTGSVKINGSLTGSFSQQAISPDHLRSDIIAGETKFIECYNGISGWRNDQRGLRSLAGDDVKQLRLHTLMLNSRLNELSKSRVSVHSQGRQLVDGRNTDAVDLRLGNSKLTLFFDAANHLLVKEERDSSEGKTEIYYGDYRKVDNVMEPFSIKIKTGADELLITVERVEHNQTLAENLFHYPSAGGSAPLPEVDTLMKSVIANQEKVQALRELYTFRETDVENEIDGDGNTKKSTTKVYDVTPISGRFIRRLLSVDGKELSAGEREKEEKKAKKEIEEAKKQQLDKQKGKKNDDDDDNITLLSFLKIIDVTNIHRDKFREQEVIVFDFVPRKNFKPSNRAESIISKLSGSFYVDERALQVVRFEARLTDSFKLGGGLLASISPSSAFVFEQEKIRDEVWLPSYTEANFGGKALLFVKFNSFTTARFSDYQKYQTDVEIRTEPDEAH